MSIILFCQFLSSFIAFIGGTMSLASSEMLIVTLWYASSEITPESLATRTGCVVSRRKFDVSSFSADPRGTTMFSLFTLNFLYNILKAVLAYGKGVSPPVFQSWVELGNSGRAKRAAFPFDYRGRYFCIHRYPTLILLVLEQKTACLQWSKCVLHFHSHVWWVY